jgi:L-asparaginase II
MNPVLVEVYRGNVLESFHRGVVCVVNNKGEITFSLGDVEQLCYPRSAMKLLQVIPFIVDGGMQKFGITLEEIAIMCGSHNAEPEHLRVVNSILQKIGLEKDALQCGPQYPSSKRDANLLIKADEKPQHIHNNCSGKHAGMLAACVLNGWSTENYINPQHPLQQRILDICSLMYEYPKEKMAIALDGCSAPIFSVPVYNQALGFKNLVTNTQFDQNIQDACAIIVKAVSAYPFMVAGTGRYCTDMMNITAPKIIGKTGAEGIFCMTFTEQQLGVCIKIDDGKMLPQYNVAQALIEASGLISKGDYAPLHPYAAAEIKNFNKLITGATKVNQELFKSFSIQIQ